MAVEFYNQAKFNLKRKCFIATSKANRPPGMPDIVGIINGITYWIEVKTAKGRVSLSQAAMHLTMHDLGWHVAVCRSIHDAKTFVDRICDLEDR
jgi:hypothetical protein